MSEGDTTCNMEIDETTESPEEEYDEALVYVEFTGIGVGDVLNQKSPEFKIIGLLDNEPTIQLGGQVFAGSLDDTIGTNLFFVETGDAPENYDIELNMRPEKWFKFDCMTSKDLIVKRIYTKKRVVEDKPLSDDDLIDQQVND